MVAEITRTMLLSPCFSLQPWTWDTECTQVVASPRLLSITVLRVAIWKVMEEKTVIIEYTSLTSSFLLYFPLFIFSSSLRSSSSSSSSLSSSPRDTIRHASGQPRQVKKLSFSWVLPFIIFFLPFSCLKQNHYLLLRRGTNTASRLHSSPAATATTKTSNTFTTTYQNQ